MSDLLTSSFGLHALREQKRAAFLLGLRAIAPGLVALTIWGVDTGVAMLRLGLTDPQRLARHLGWDAGVVVAARVVTVVLGSQTDSHCA